MHKNWRWHYTSAGIGAKQRLQRGKKCCLL